MGRSSSRLTAPPHSTWPARSALAMPTRPPAPGPRPVTYTATRSPPATAQPYQTPSPSRLEWRSLTARTPSSPSRAAPLEMRTPLSHTPALPNQLPRSVVFTTTLVPRAPTSSMAPCPTPLRYTVTSSTVTLRSPLNSQSSMTAPTSLATWHPKPRVLFASRTWCCPLSSSVVPVISPTKPATLTLTKRLMSPTTWHPAPSPLVPALTPPRPVTPSTTSWKVITISHTPPLTSLATRPWK